ncbi:MAG TPA: PAS domain S-box protein, partial [Roseiarcus sp.]|nr:PAS domain S-box protein [Roseiarcus sp.]
EAETSLEFAQKARFGLVADVIRAQLRLILTLRGLTPKFGCFTDAEFDERQFEDRLKNDPALAYAGWRYWIRKLQARWCAGDYASAIEAAAQAERLLSPSFLAYFELAEHHFYAALARASYLDAAPADRRSQCLDLLFGHRRRLEDWARHCPQNFECRAALVGAEIARLEGRELDAERLYEQAIRSARANDFIHIEALAHELAARFYAARGFDTIAQTYLRNARYGYARWGADGKVRQLDETHPHLRPEEQFASTTTIGAPVEQLDLATVIKVSQAASSELALDKLVDSLMRTAIEQAGAERGLLLLQRGDEFRIEAEATSGGGAVIVRLCDQPATAAALPESVIHYVARARESVIVDDAAAQPLFADDPYVHRREARSILCLPLIHQGQLSGMLYLENSLAPGVFSPARIAVLKLLASQATMALENTRLYRDLAAREARIRRLVDANIIGIFVGDDKGRFLEVNDAFIRMLGFDREDLLSGRILWMGLTPPEWKNRSAQALAEAKRTGAAQPYEKEYFRRDGRRVPVLIGLASIEDATHQNIAFVLDLTERKRAEAALRASEEQWKAIFENNPTMYFMVDESGTILSVNPFGAEQLGYTTDELVGRPVKMLVHETDVESALNNKAICLEHLGQTRSWELRKVRKDGEALWVRETGRAMLIRNRPVVLVVSEDITERKRAEEALRETQAELAHANRLETMGQLAASIAHEVNQPIAATMTNAQAGLRWLDRPTPNLEEAKQALGRIVRDGARAGAVIDRIRRLIKRTAARDDRVDVNAAVGEVVEVARSEATKNGVSMRMELAEGLPPVQGDRVELQQVILNLIVNAIEAMSGAEGPRELRIGAEKSEAGDVLVSVSDSGPGLAPAARDNLFKAFHTTKPGGLGLGLSICRSIVEAHGGRLWASANAPRGAVFQFTLPSHPGVVEARPPQDR